MYLKYLQEMHYKKPILKEQGEATSIIQGALKQVDSLYKEKIKQCKGGMFKRVKNPQECFLKVKRSSFRSGVSYLKDNVHRCSDKKCKSELTTLAKKWQGEVDHISAQLERM